MHRWHYDVIPENSSPPAAHTEPINAPDRQRRLLRMTTHPTTLLIVGTVTLIATTLMLSSWIGLHADAWRADWECSSGFETRLAIRRLISITAGGSLLTLAVATVWLGFRRDHRRRVIAVFWAAVCALWIIMFAMVTTGGYWANLCSRGFAL